VSWKERGERREGRGERSERKEKRVEAEKDEGEGVSMTTEFRF
jgi:hypothetical protein